MANMPTNEEKLKAFEEALKHINSEIKSESGTLISRMGDTPPMVETISTGSLVLDSIVGGGFPKGRIIELFGAESSGKTTFALTAAANVQAQGGTVAFIDFENALDPRYARALGVDIANMALAQPDYAEQGLQLVENLAASGAVDLIIVDSVAALVPKQELEGDLEQQSIGLVARILSRSLKKLIATANRTKTTIILINQTRVAIGQFSPMGTPTDTTGGKALKFYASQRIEIRKGQQIKEGGEVLGVQTRMSVKKNKIAPPFLTGETVITFGKGINKAVEMIEVGPTFGVITKPNNRTYVETATGEIFAKSKADAVAAIENDPALYDRLAQHLKDIIAGKLADDGSLEDVAGDHSDGDDEA